MSCDVTKLEYLEETKRLFRATIDPKNEKITDATPFRAYADFMKGAATSGALDIAFAGSKITSGVFAAESEG